MVAIVNLLLKKIMMMMMMMKLWPPSENLTNTALAPSKLLVPLFDRGCGLTEKIKRASHDATLLKCMLHQYSIYTLVHYLKQKCWSWPRTSDLRPWKPFRQCPSHSHHSLDEYYWQDSLQSSHKAERSHYMKYVLTDGQWWMVNVKVSHTRNRA